MESSSPSDEELLAEVKDYSERVAASLPDIIPAAGLTLKSKLPFKALMIRELLIHRVSELASAAVENFEKGRTVAGVSLTRAVVESVAVLYALHEHVAKFLQDKDAESLDGFLMKTLMGSRSDGDLPVATNIITLVNRLHKEVDGARPLYDALSEITHPNWAGLLGSFGTLDRQKYELLLGARSNTQGNSLGLSALSGTLMTFEHYYNDLANKIDELNKYFEGEAK